MSPGWRLSRAAGQDLEEIEDYTARVWGDQQAEAYIRDLFAAFDRLANNPALGRHRPDIPAIWLCYSVGRHLIVYRLKDDQVEILNILHPRMDIAARLRRD